MNDAMSPAADLQALADQIKARRSLPYSPILRMEAVKDERPYYSRANETCTLCGGTESGRHPWRGFVGTCTCSGGVL